MHKPTKHKLFIFELKLCKSTFLPQNARSKKKNCVIDKNMMLIIATKVYLKFGCIEGLVSSRNRSKLN